MLGSGEGDLKRHFVQPQICRERISRIEMAVFILEDALPVQTNNASMAVFILRTHYPTGRTWANICSSSGYASQV